MVTMEITGCDATREPIRERGKRASYERAFDPDDYASLAALPLPALLYRVLVGGMWAREGGG